MCCKIMSSFCTSKWTCLILLLFSTVVDYSYGTKFHKKDKICPLTCNCWRGEENKTEISVSCRKSKYWNTIPWLPDNTTYFAMTKANITTLYTRSFEMHTRNTLRYLKLGGINVSQIEAGALQNFNQLLKLELKDNRLIKLPKKTFINMTGVDLLDINGNFFTEIPFENVCLLRNIQQVKIYNNRITNACFDECFTNLTKLWSIDFSSNPIKEISPNDFRGLRHCHISILYMRQLEISSLTKQNFVFVPHVRALELTNNKLTSLTPDFFHHLWGLNYLTLRGDELNQILNGALWNMSYLQSLNLNENQISNCTFGESFQNVSLLKSLYIRHNPIGALRNSSFSKLKFLNVTHLDVSYSKLQVIEADAFASLRHLMTLQINNNRLNTSMMEQAFHGLKHASNLTNLFIQTANLSELNPQSFQLLANTSVSNLQASDIRLKSIPAGLFKHLPKLKILKLSSNFIDDIQTGAFEGLQVLEQLDLSNNRLLAMPNAHDVKLHNLKFLSFKKNYIKGKITNNSTEGYAQLEILRLDNNMINNIAPQALSHIPNLRSLNLNSNKIVYLPKDVFFGLSKLKSLFIRQNNLNWFDLNIFHQTPQLESLDLSRNIYLTTQIRERIPELFAPLGTLKTLTLTAVGLKDLPGNTFQNLTELSTVALSANQIMHWPVGLFQEQSKLKTISIANNKLTTISKRHIDHLEHLEKLFVNDNMLICDCELLWFTDWIKIGKVYMADIDHLTCNSPPEKKGVKLLDLNLDEECMSFQFYKVYWSILGLWIILVTMGTMGYRFRWYIRYWRHLVRAQKAMKEEMGEERFVFDAFVSYTRHDQKWVIRELLSKVEYEANIKLCLHQRNWIIASSVPGNILKSIRKSRKTVLVLSNAYARSYWCELEMVIAQQKILTSERDVVVPILLEPIRKRYMTEQMICLFATQTYIKWPQRNEKKQRRFWKRLIKTLRPPQEPPEYDEDNRDFLTNIR